MIDDKPHSSFTVHPLPTNREQTYENGYPLWPTAQCNPDVYTLEISG